MLRALLGIVAGSLLGALCAVLAYASSPAITFDMSRYLPDLLPGFYEPEVAEGRLFAWTAEEGRVELRGLDRRIEWTCAIQMSGGMRPANVPVPSEVTVAADGVVLARAVPQAGYSDMSVRVPARPQDRGLVLSIRPAEWFMPGPQDRRHLGLVVSRIACEPASGRWPLPPAAVIGSAAIGAGVMAGVAAVLGAGLAGTLVVALAVAGLQSMPITMMFAPYGEYALRTRQMVVWAALPVLVAALWARLRRHEMSTPGRFVALFSSTAFYLKLLTLLHPAKDVIDAIFQAHRFEWVLAGRYYFTSVTPRGYKFPYAIGLYLVAAPFAPLMDHVSLLRVVVLAAWTMAGVTLYLAAARVWKDRLAGAVAAVLFNTVPVVYDIVSSANHPNAFGEAMAVVAVCAMVLAIDRWKRPALAFSGVALLILTAMGSHLSTFATLTVTLVATCAATWKWGVGPLRRRAVWAGAIVIAMVAIVVVAYYGHFIDVYTAQARRVQSETGNLPASRTLVLVDPTQRRDVAPGAEPQGVPLWMRAVLPVAQAGVSFGWPLLPLAAAGFIVLIRERRRDPLSLALAGWMTMFVAFLVLGMVTPVEMRYHLSASGALALAGGAGVSAAWRRAPAVRALAVLLVAASIATALYTCWTWIR